MARFRKRYEFWLDLNAPQELELAEVIDELKQRRGYASAIRQGLQIVWELRQRKTDTLLKLFPFLVEQGLKPEPSPEELLRQFFPGMIVTIAPPGMTPTALMPQQMPMFDPEKFTTPVAVTAVFDESAAKARSVANTLAAIENF